MSEEISTQEKSITKTLVAIVAEAKRIEENCMVTSKSHFVVAHFWSKFHLCIGIPTLILALIAGMFAFANFEYHDAIAGVISFIVTISTGVSLFLNPDEKSKMYLTSGNNYDSLLSRVRIFWSIDCWKNDSEETLTAKLKDFSEQRDRLNRDCQQPPKWAYKIAKKGIEEGETDYKVDVK